jgi:hypothetical protein
MFRSPGTRSVVGTPLLVPCHPCAGVRISACANVAVTGPPSGSATVARRVTSPPSMSVVPDGGESALGGSGIPADRNTTSRVAALPNASSPVTVRACGPAARPGPTSAPSSMGVPSRLTTGPDRTPVASSRRTSSGTAEAMVSPAAGVLAAITGPVLSVTRVRKAT